MKTRSRSRNATPDSKIAPTVKCPVLVVISLSGPAVTGTTAVTGSPIATWSFSASVEPIAIAPSDTVGGREDAGLVVGGAARGSAATCEGAGCAGAPGADKLSSDPF